MYIVRQNGRGIVNSNHVTALSIRSWGGAISGNSSDLKGAVFITADYDGKSTYLATLGGYTTLQKAYKVFQILFSALQDNVSVFFMP